jgi:hypothetical protein
LSGKKIPQRPEFIEFIGIEEFPIFSGIRVEREAAVKMKRPLLPTGKAKPPFRYKGPAATRTAGGIIQGEQGQAIPAKAMPGFLPVQEGSPAEGAASRKKTFPQKGKG